jgi:general secretion pathway protein E
MVVPSEPDGDGGLAEPSSDLDDSSTDHGALDPQQASAWFLQRIPRSFARDHLVLSQGALSGNALSESALSERAFSERALSQSTMSEQDAESAESELFELIACSSACSPAVRHNVQARLRRPVTWVIRDAGALAEAIDTAYERQLGASITNEANKTAALAIVLPQSGTDMRSVIDQTEQDLLASAGKAPVVQLVDRLLFQAVQLGASDIHLQPLPEHVVVRHRLDGVLDRGYEMPSGLLRPVMSRIKVLGRMDVAERLMPQDGRASVRIGDRSLDLRISTIPTPHGERAVLRLLDANASLQEFAALGMPSEVAQPFMAAARRSSGIVLVTGPTGSGKTTTLYATLRELDAHERNIMTIEDPIEYELDSLGLPIAQSQVNVKKGVTFANGLRHLLRQDPDIIMIGEIRDAETARTAIQASLTGHLVFSTLHTNDAPSAVSRLIDLGVEPYLVAASLSAVLAQRLVRQCCSNCNGTGLVQGHTCTRCQGSGYRGRRGVFELLTISEAMRQQISIVAPLTALREQAAADGMTSLGEAGARLVAAGRTTAVEVERVVHG